MNQAAVAALLDKISRLTLPPHADAILREAAAAIAVLAARVETLEAERKP